MKYFFNSYPVEFFLNATALFLILRNLIASLKLLSEQ